MIAQDDPGHAEQRALVARRLTPRGVVPQEQPLRVLIDELLDAVADAGEMEVVDALAAQLPSRHTADLLGFPQDRWRDLKSWSERMMRLDSIPRDASGEVLQGVMAAITDFQAYLNEAVPRFREEPNRFVHLGVGQRFGTRLPDERSHDHERDGSVHLRRRRDHPHRDRPWPAGLLRSPGPVGAARGGSISDPRRRRGDPAVGVTAQPDVPHGDSRRPHRRHARACGRPNRTALSVGQPRRRSVRRAVPLRHHPQPEPA